MDAGPSDDVEPPEIAELRCRHYEAFDELTGDRDLGLLWPPEHRVIMAETRSWPDHRERLFVRSPWPAPTAAEVVTALFDYLPVDSTSPVARSGRELRSGFLL
ncbi:MAG: hypothetical protein QOE71_2148 [Pseudonocardiales bacterium]|nr:hypothetical protein [Pseudonocardiales bacterium]